MSIIKGNNSNNTLYGTENDDTIYGYGGHDTLMGRGGADTLDGGDGFDRASFESSSVGVGVNLAIGRGFDGDAEGDVLISIEGLIGSYYNDSLIGDGDYNEINGHNGADYIDGAGGSDLLQGSDKNDILVGGDGDDILDGGHDNDTLKGGGGADTLIGGPGTDTASYTDSWMRVTVNLPQNVGDGGAFGDTYSSVENIVGTAYNDLLIGNGEWNSINGGDGDDIVEGGIGNDTLNGDRGNDTMVGGVGQDVFYVDSIGDVIIEYAGQGFDSAYASVSYALAADVEVERLRPVDYFATTPINLTGNNLANEVLGNLGDNVLDGGGGADRLEGYRGNDWYFVDDSGDRVLEYDGNGADRVFAAVSYALAPDAAIEIMSTTYHSGTAAINLTGSDFANAIYGNAGDNILDGAAGADTLTGWAGNDWYFVDNAGDAISDGVGEGALDRVFASASYTLTPGAEIELMSTTYHPGTDPINLTGNEFADTIYGNAGANTLDGQGGIDTLVGLGGDDWYYVDNALDSVTEAAGQGNDRVLASVSYTLAAGQEIEKLTTDNNAGLAPINLIGNEFANTIYGNAGSNALKGGLGADTLVGLGDMDAFVFNTALGAGNIDNIADFNVVDDDIVLASWVFTGLSAGTLAANEFRVGSAAADADDHIIYNSVSGAVLFDADGIGGAAAIQFATMTAGLGVTNADFIVV